MANHMPPPSLEVEEDLHGFTARLPKGATTAELHIEVSSLWSLVTTLLSMAGAVALGLVSLVGGLIWYVHRPRLSVGSDRLQLNPLPGGIRRIDVELAGLRVEQSSELVTLSSVAHPAPIRMKMASDAEASWLCERLRDAAARAKVEAGSEIPEDMAQLRAQAAVRASRVTTRPQG